MKSFTAIISALMLAGLALSTNLSALTLNEARWQAFTTAAITEHIVPRYRQLAVQSATLSSHIDTFCSDQSAANLAEAQQQFKQALQAWQGIQHIQFGPVTLLMRNFSLQYWPDKKNLGGRQLNTLLKQALAGDTEQDYNQEFFARASVAVKGYPAIERMLFDQQLTSQLASNPSYCPLLQAISHHVGQNTQAIVNEWQQELSHYQNYTEDSLYISAQEAATDILKALIEPIEAISDGKIARPLGISLSKMRWRKSESWRSGQSIANLRANLETLHHLYSGISTDSLYALLVESGESATAKQIEREFLAVMAAIATVTEPKNMQYQPAEFEQLLQIQVQLKQLSNLLLASMKPLQISLGFNRRDGD
ncbi:MAG: imelysin family protein [Oceanospirillaceae bacterium]|nr:imelysin family protein [Oceanospirillaceae bacterium]